MPDREITKELIIALGVDPEQFSAEDSRRHFDERDAVAVKGLEAFRAKKGIAAQEVSTR